MQVNRERLLSVVNGDWNAYKHVVAVEHPVLGGGGDVLLGKGHGMIVWDWPLLRHDIHVLLHATRSDAPDSVTLEEPRT